MTKNNFRTEKRVVKIDMVNPNPFNPNSMDSFMFAKAKKSFEELGMLGSIIVREWAGEYQILDGEHRWKVAKELQWTEIPVEVIIGEVSDDMAKLLTIQLNNLHGKDDIFKRAKILAQLNAGQLSLLPWTEEQIENEKKFVEFDFAQFEVGQTQETGEVRLTVLSMPISNESKQIWKKTYELAKKDGIQTEEQLLMHLVKNYLDLNLGAAVGQTTHSL